MRAPDQDMVGGLPLVVSDARALRFDAISGGKLTEILEVTWMIQRVEGGSVAIALHEYSSLKDIIQASTYGL